MGARIDAGDFVETVLVGRRALPPARIVARDPHALERRHAARACDSDHSGERERSRRAHARSARDESAADDLEIDEGPRIFVAIIRREVGSPFTVSDPKANFEPAPAERLGVDEDVASRVARKTGAVSGPDQLAAVLNWTIWS